MNEKRCSQCKEVKPSGEFWFRDKNIGRLTSWCRSCSREKWKEYLKRYRQDPRHRERARIYGKQYRVIAKMAAFSHYGGNPPQCACCGEKTMGFLTLDHINGGGRKERKMLCRGGVSLAIFLRKRGYPAGYRVLCYNCNCALAFLKVCPHGIEQQKVRAS